MKKFINWFSRGLIRYRYGFLFLCLIISSFFVYQLKNIFFKTDISDFYPLRHPYLKIQNEPNKIFGSLKQVYIAIEVKPYTDLSVASEDGSLRLNLKNDTILNPVTLDKVWQITNQLYLTDGIDVGGVVSLSARKVKHVQANEEGFTTQWLMHDPPKTQEEINILKERVLRNPLVYGPIVSRDFRATLIQADFESYVSSRQIFKILHEIKKKYEDKNHNIYISGHPVLQGWLDYYLPRMGGLLITILAMSFVLYNAFKR